MVKKIICLITITLTTLCFIGFSSYGSEYARFGINGGYYYFENDGKTMHITNDKSKHDNNIEYTKAQKYVEKIIIDNLILMESAQSLFRGFINVNSIEGLDNLYLSNVTNMSNMFYGCSKLEKLDIGNWDTSNVPDIEWMFFACSNLKTLDIGNWDISKVTSMNSMFYRCSKLETLKIGDWDISNELDMDNMFYACSVKTPNWFNEYEKSHKEREKHWHIEIESWKLQGLEF